MPPPKVPRILSHYRLGPLLGSGGMGSVYQATDRRDGSPAAIKLLNPMLASDSSFVERFEREAHLGALLRSPYTAQLLQYGFDSGHYFIVMEYVEGETLGQVLRGGPLESNQALKIAVQVARALEEAEARGVVHRDIKPDNVVLRPDGSVKVLDFGIARQLVGGTLTIPGGFLGTLLYAAPEQAAGKTDHRTDIYAVGATLYHLLSGQPPYAGGVMEMISQPAAAGPPLEPLAGLPEPVIEVVTRCLQRDPDDRYQSATELAAALEKVRRTTNVPAESVGDEASTVVADAAATELAEAATPARPTEPPAVPGQPETAPPKQVETPAVTAADTAPPAIPVSPPQPAPRPAAAAMILGSVSGGLSGGRMGASTCSVKITNPGAEPLRYRVNASEPGGECVFSGLDTLEVPAGSSRTGTLRIKPRERRKSGPTITRELSVTATPVDGGGPPLSGTTALQGPALGLVPLWRRYPRRRRRRSSHRRVSPCCRRWRWRRARAAHADGRDRHGALGYHARRGSGIQHRSHTIRRLRL